MSKAKQNKDWKSEEYKGWEYFVDPCYYHMVAVRPIGCRNFNETQHVASVEAAITFIDSQQEN